MNKLRKFSKRAISRLLEKSFQLRLYSTKVHGRDSDNDIVRYIRNPRVMFDVGANIGQTATAWLDLYPNATIYSFEPVQECYERLAKIKHDRFHCFNLGMGEQKESRNIFYGAHSVSHSFVHQLGSGGCEEAKLTTIDTFCEEQNIEYIDVLKLDVEGYEPLVVKGADRMLREQRIRILKVELGFSKEGYYVYYSDFADAIGEYGYVTLGFYDQLTKWDKSAELLLCNVLFAKKDLVETD